MSLYRTEFPDYDDVLRIPKGFVDCSYHNDICPHVSQYYRNEETELMINIWQDYVDPDKREYSDYPRFIFSIEINGDVIFECKTDVWEEIEKLLPCLLKPYGWKNELE